MLPSRPRTLKTCLLAVVLLGSRALALHAQAPPRSAVSLGHGAQSSYRPPALLFVRLA
jgi:hypothetical protein